MIETKMLSKLKRLLPFVMFEGIETSTTNGFPDVIYGFEDMLGFIELKKLDRVPVKKFTMPWRAGQLAWYKRFSKKCHSPYLVILTIEDSWYFITIIKETYTMAEVNQFYVGETTDLSKMSDLILMYMFTNDH